MSPGVVDSLKKNIVPNISFFLIDLFCLGVALVNASLLLVHRCCLCFSVQPHVVKEKNCI